MSSSEMQISNKCNCSTQCVTNASCEEYVCKAVTVACMSTIIGTLLVDENLEQNKDDYIMSRRQRLYISASMGASIGALSGLAMYIYMRHR